MSGYSKLYGKELLASSVWQYGWHIKLVWVTLLSYCEWDGDVKVSIPGLASLAGVDVGPCEEAVNLFLSPDKYSRSKEYEGRRIKEIEGGYNILNYEKYRDRSSDNSYRERAKDRQQRYRDRQKSNDESRNVTPPSLHTASDAATDAATNAATATDQDKLLKIVPIPKPKKRKPKYAPGYGTAVWEAYSEGFERRYGVKPKRNAKQSSLACQLRERLGDADSVEVARYYPTNQNSFHIGRGHALAHLVSDAEKVWTEWMTGNQITTTGAREQDRLKKTGDGWARAIAKVCKED